MLEDANLLVSHAFAASCLGLITIEIDVFPPSEVANKTGALLDERCNLALDPDASGGGRGGVGQQFEQGALAGAVVADDAQHFARLNAEADNAQGLEGLALFDAQAAEAVQGVESGLLDAGELPQAIFLGDVGGFDDGHVRMAGVSDWQGGQLAQMVFSCETVEAWR